MSGKNQIKPTEAELEILQVLWENGPSAVRFVNDKLNEKKATGKPVSYTGTLKLMQIMTEKSLLKRDTNQRSHIYDSEVKEDTVQLQMLDRFVDATFRGSAMKLVMQALGQHKATQEELDEIKAMINKIEKGK